MSKETQHFRDLQKLKLDPFTHLPRSKRTGLTPEQIRTIVEAGQTMTVRQIMERYGFSRANIKRILARHGE